MYLDQAEVRLVSLEDCPSASPLRCARAALGEGLPTIAVKVLPRPTDRLKSDIQLSESFGSVRILTARVFTAVVPDPALGRIEGLPEPAPGLGETFGQLGVACFIFATNKTTLLIPGESPV